VSGSWQADWRRHADFRAYARAEVGEYVRVGVGVGLMEFKLKHRRADCVRETEVVVAVPTDLLNDRLPARRADIARRAAEKLKNSSDARLPAGLSRQRGNHAQRLPKLVKE